MRSLFCATLGGILCLSLPLLASAGKADTTKSPVAATEATAEAGQMRVFIDPQTGRRINQPVTIEQQRAAESGMGLRQAGPVEEIHHANGMVEHVFNGAADSQLVVRVGTDGQRHQQCDDASHGHAAATAAVEVSNER